MIDGKIIDYVQDREKLSQIKGNKVLVGGCFDVLHIGHVRFLKKAKKNGENLIIALEGDDFIRIKKNRIPLHTQYERAEILLEMRCVDYVILLPYFSSDQDYDLLVAEVAPNVIAITSGDILVDRKKNQAKKFGGRLVEVIKPIPDKSSRKIIKIIKK